MIVEVTFAIPPFVDEAERALMNLSSVLELSLLALPPESAEQASVRATHGEHERGPIAGYPSKVQRHAYLQSMKMGSPLEIVMQLSPIAYAATVLGFLQFIRDYRPKQQQAWAKAYEMHYEARLDAVTAQAAEDRRRAVAALYRSLQEALDDPELREVVVRDHEALLRALDASIKLPVESARDVTDELQSPE